MKAWPDWDEFVRRLREDPAFREEVRRQVLTEDLLNLPAVVQAGLAALADRMERAEAQIRENGRQIAENGRQIAALTEALREFRAAAERRFAAAEAQIAENSRQIAALTDRRSGRRPRFRKTAGRLPPSDSENSRQIAALTEALRDFQAAAKRRFAALERDVRGLKDDVRTLQGSVGRLTGRDFERRFLSRASRIFLGGGNLGAALRQAAGEALQAGVISRDEWQRLDSLDLLWGRGGTVFVGEISEAVGEDDVLRVRWSVEILRRLGWGRGLRLLPVVVGRKVGRVPKGVGWVRWDPDEEVLKISRGIETILREEEPEPVEPERFFGGGADDSPLRETD
jgi:hypothetical protein